MLGPFNKLWKSLENLHSDINQLPLKYSLVREDYFGKTFEGNEVNKLLKHIDELRKILPEDDHIFVDNFESLNEVKQACFGFVLEENYKEKIRKFEKKWMKLHENYKVSIPNKCHVIF